MEYPAGHCPEMGGPRCAQATAFLDSLVAGRPHILEPSIRRLIDLCDECTRRYNEIKWARSEGSTGLVELERFLGNQFQYGINASDQLDKEWRQRAPRDPYEVEAFYRETPWYVYNLVLWEASGRRPNYVQQAMATLNTLQCQTIIDFGAGVGNDALKFALQGYTVIAVEFDNLASRFLRYRAHARKLDNLMFVDFDSVDLTKLRADALWAMDVIEHLPNPVETLTPILANTRIFLFDSEHTGTSHGRQEFHYQHSPAELAKAWSARGYKPLKPPQDAGTVKVYYREENGRSEVQKVRNSALLPAKRKPKLPLTTVVLDLDGVVWRDNRAVSGIASAVEDIRSRSLAPYYLTNNTTESRLQLSERMRQIKIEVQPDKIFTASLIAATYLSSHKESSALYVVVSGTDTLINDLRIKGLRCESLPQYAGKSPSGRESCSIVIGYKPDFGYEDIEQLLSVSSMVTDVFAAESDLWYSTSNGPKPGSSWIVAAVETILQKTSITLGKPNATALRTLAEVEGVEIGSILMVGDSVDVDVVAANNAGCISCYFDDLQIDRTPNSVDGDAIPDFVIRDLGELRYVLMGLTR